MLRRSCMTWRRMASIAINKTVVRGMFTAKTTSTLMSRPVARVGLPAVPCRSMFIQTKDSPNPNSLIFTPGKEVMGAGQTIDFPSYKSAQSSPLAKGIFAIDGVSRAFFGEDFISVTITDDADWLVVKPHVFAAIMDFYASGQAVVLENTHTQNNDTEILDDDDDAVAMIKEIIETRVRPHVQGDGGDIKYIKFEKGIVWLQLQGSCAGCPSSSVTLKHGIENMLMHYVEEVTSVEEWVDEDEQGDEPMGEPIDAAELKRMEEALSQVKRNGN